jgi:hypothetical protein
MVNKLTDHAIASLYQKGAKEQPSAVLDAHILQLAKKHVTITPIIKKRRVYQTWYAQLSTAASFVLVAILYFEMNKPFQSNQEPDISDQHSINQLSAPQNAQSDSFLNAPVLMNKSKQATRIEEPNNLMQSDQDEIFSDDGASDQDEIFSDDGASVHGEIPFSAEKRSLKDSVLFINPIEIPITYVLEVEATFKEIEVLLTKGESKQANLLLKTLITAHPELENVLNSRYEILEEQAVPQP